MRFIVHDADPHVLAFPLEHRASRNRHTNADNCLLFNREGTNQLAVSAHQVLKGMAFGQAFRSHRESKIVLHDDNAVPRIIHRKCTPCADCDKVRKTTR